MKITALASAVLLFCGAALTASQSPALQRKGLKDYYKACFPIGVAVGLTSLKGP